MLLFNLSFFIVVAYGTCSARDRDKLEYVNKPALRVVFNDKENSYDELLRKIEMVNLEQRRVQNMLITVFKCLYGAAPSYLRSHCKERTSAYSLRDHAILELPSLKKQALMVSILFVILARMSGIGDLMMSGDRRRCLVFGAGLSGTFAKAGHCNIDILLLKHSYCCNVPILFHFMYLFIYLVKLVVI